MARLASRRQIKSSAALFIRSEFRIVPISKNGTLTASSTDPLSRVIRGYFSDSFKSLINSSFHKTAMVWLP